MSAPLVALTSTTKIIDGMTRVRLNEAYVDAVRAVGLIPLILPPLPPQELEPVLSVVHGVVLTGGEDVDPAEYGAARSPETQPPHKGRDKCELALVGLARERGLPTLAICRGLQVANVALGGTLIQDIPSECPSNIGHDQSDERGERVHDVSIDRASRLAAAVGASSIAVNSSHHQALARVAPGLLVTSRSSDGIIEGAEWPGDDWWMLGVQWHPEELVRDTADWDRGLFKAFALAVKSSVARKP
jgi:putative glutamine amidotransferase